MTSQQAHGTRGQGAILPDAADLYQGRSLFAQAVLIRSHGESIYQHSITPRVNALAILSLESPGTTLATNFSGYSTSNHNHEGPLKRPATLLSDLPHVLEDCSPPGLFALYLLRSSRREVLLRRQDFAFSWGYSPAQAQETVL